MIYLDNNASTPADKRVVEIMMPFFSDSYGNPHSTNHLSGIESKKAIEESREIIANFFNTDVEGVVFTSGATESNNLAISGCIQKAIKNGTAKKKIICSAIEHKCVLECCMMASKHGFETIIIPVDGKGYVDFSFLLQQLGDDTLLVSMMGTNNETGVDLQIEKISKICAEKKIFFHSDLAQSLNHKSFNFDTSSIDFASISGHKIYGPKGIGALICKENPSDNLEPLMLGGYQEAGIRSGTLPTALCVGLAKSISILSKEQKQYAEHYKSLKTILWKSLKNNISSLEQNTPNAEHPGTMNLYFPEVDGEALCTQLANKVAVSTAAACNSNNYEYSYVLKAMGYNKDRCKNSIRLCVGRQNTKDEMLRVSQAIKDCYFYLLNI